MIDEPEGGEAACLAHILTDVEEQIDSPGGAPQETGLNIVDLAAVARRAAEPGAAWTHQSDDLNVNLLVFATDQGVEEHINAEVDVLLVGIAGEGVVTVDGARRILRPGRAMVIAEGARRATRGLRAPFAYLTCHRRRAGLWPRV
jgi:quercetin dioxygenase-like cupin family protein